MIKTINGKIYEISIVEKSQGNEPDVLSLQFESCIGGNNAACNERREVYLEAMELRKKLEAQGIKVGD